MKLIKKNSYKEVKFSYDKEKDGRIKLRLLIILTAFKLKSSYKIAEQVKTSHTKVQRWIKRFNKHGLAGLKDKPRSGSPARLTKVQLQELDQELSRKKEFSVGWRTPEIIEKVQSMFKVKYTIVHIRRLLHTLGYSKVKPRPSHVSKKPIEGKERVKEIKKNSYVWVKNGLSLQKMNLA